MRYRIGEFARAAGVSPKTLRFYDEIGLLRPAGIDPRTRYRFYISKQLQDLALITELKDMGASLVEIRRFTERTKAGIEPGKARHVILEQLKDALEQSIHASRQRLEWINLRLQELHGSKQEATVVIKRQPAISIASLRGSLAAYSDIQRFESELLNALPERSMGALRGVLWHRCADSGGLEGEAFVELSANLPRRSYYDLKSLPPVTVACAYSGVEDDQAEIAYDAIRAWMLTHGYKLAGPKREIYLDYMLEIQFPLQ